MPVRDSESPMGLIRLTSTEMVPMLSATVAMDKSIRQKQVSQSAYLCERFEKPPYRGLLLNNFSRTAADAMHIAGENGILESGTKECCKRCIHSLRRFFEGAPEYFPKLF